MKAKLLIFLLCLSNVLMAQNLDIPDASFKACLISNTALNTNGDDEIQLSEAQNYEGEILCENKGINSLKGLDTFVKLKRLNVKNNELESIDVSKNIGLVFLDVSYNKMIELSVVENTSLNVLRCNDNNLSTLNCSSNLLLTSLSCNNNNLQILDLSINKKLRSLYCQNNNLKSLNVANGNNKNFLAMSFNSKNNPNLYCINKDIGFTPSNGTFYWQRDRQTVLSDDCYIIVDIPDVNFKSELLKNESINKNKDNEINAYETTHIYGGLELSNKGIKDLTGINAFKKISSLNVSNNALTQLNIDIPLISLDCSYNTIKTLKVNNENLGTLLCNDNEIVSLGDLVYENIGYLNCNNNNLSELSAVLGDNIYKLYCNNNAITSLNLLKKYSLKELDCSFNNLNSLNMSQTIIENINCSNNNLKVLNLSNQANSDTWLVNVLNNPGLTCVNIDKGFMAPDTWQKDDATVFNDSCVLSQTVNISDENFKKILLENGEINVNNDDNIQISEAVAYGGVIDIANQNINNVEGLDYFKNITGLYCNNNNLVNLNLSKNINLQTLNCANNKLGLLNIANGNNANMTLFNATNNFDLQCINVDKGFVPPSSWSKDDSAAYNELCENAIVVDIPDVNFKNSLLADGLINLNGDQEIQLSEAIQTDVINCPDKNIKSLKGIEAFERLRALVCSNNKLTSINLQYNSNIKSVSLGNNQITSADFSKNSILQRVQIDNNKLQRLDVANFNNKFLRFLDATNNSELTCINIDRNFDPPSSTFWKKDATAEFWYDCPPILGIVNIPDANFKSYLISNAKINKNGDTEIQTDEAKYFYGTIDCSNKNIKSLEGIEFFTKITSLYCNDNQLTSLDLKRNTELVNLNCKSNNLKELNVSQSTKLLNIYCSNNNLSALNTANNTELKIIDCSNNEISYLNFKTNENLENLDCSSNQVESLFLTKNKNLITLKCLTNKLKVLNVNNGNNVGFNAFDARYNWDLTCINIDDNFQPTEAWLKDGFTEYSSSCPQFTEIVDIPNEKFKAYLLNQPLINLNEDDEIQVVEAKYYHGKIEFYDYNYNGTNLKGLEAFANVKEIALNIREIAGELNFKQNINLESLYANCNFTSLDLANNVKLKTLDLGYNNKRLKSLNVENCTKLEFFKLNDTQINKLDFSNHPNLKQIYCSGNNNLRELNVANGNNKSLEGFFVFKSEALLCIAIDKGFTPPKNGWRKPNECSYSDNCEAPLIYIPDANFKAALLEDEAINTNGDDEIQFTEALNFKDVIKCDNRNVKDLTGIEEFVNIIGLDCHNNQIEELPLTSNLELRYLNCRNNNISDLQSLRTMKLEQLYCGFNKINYLYFDRTGVNNTLKVLNCHYNQIDDINAQNITALEELNCFNNKLKTLDVSKNKNLTILRAHTNSLTELNVANGNNSNFSVFDARYNWNLECVNIDEGYTPTSGDGETGWNKEDFTSYSDNCSYVDVITIPDNSFRSCLIYNYEINTNRDREIQVSEAENYTGVIDCSNRWIKSLEGIEYFTNVTSLYCYSNQLTSLDVSNNTKLINLNCYTNQLTNLDVSNNKDLLGLYCGWNKLDSLDVSKNEKLQELYCDNMSLTSLNVANGNNQAVVNFKATDNSSLSCIQIDTGFSPNDSWLKDDNAAYSDNCSSNAALESSSFNLSVAKIVPNPVSSMLNVVSKVFIEKLEVYDLYGKKIAESKASKINVSKLQIGTYVLKISTKNNDVITKYFVKH